MSNSEFIDVTCEQGVMQIGINRPDKKNALNRAMYDAIRSAFLIAEHDPQIKSVLLYGAAGAFTAGNDLADFNNRDPSKPSPAAVMLEVIHDFSKPVVAAVAGLAVGIGATILLHCDLVYAAPETRFRLPFVALGVCPEAGSSLMVPALAGHRLAAELLMLGDFFTAKTALDAGFVTRIVSDDDIKGFGFDKAVQLAQQPVEALSMTKRLLKQSQRQVVKERMTEEFMLFNQMLQSDESIAVRQKLSAQLKK